MSQAPFTDPLQELQAQLDVTPSPAFAVRVRARARETRGRSARGWIAAAAGVTIAIAGITMSIQTVRLRPDATTRDDIQAVRLKPDTTTRDDSTVVASAFRRTDEGAARGARRARTTTQEPEVIVSPDLLAGLEQFRARLRDGTLNSSVVPLTWNERLQASLPAPGTPPTPPKLPGLTINELVRYGG
jgi:hypothetical protein